MLRWVFILCACLFVVSGCIYNDEPVPEITHDYTKDSKVIKPTIKPTPQITLDTDYRNIPRSWVPPTRLENKNRWQGIIVHHSAGYYGSAAHEDKYHKSKGWDGLGYHFVINNGVYKNGYGNPNGLVEVGYRWQGQKNGAHCRVSGDYSNYYNKHTIGICLIGNFQETSPTSRQWRSLVKLIRFLQARYNIPTSKIKGHRDAEPTDCPGRNFSMPKLKALLSR